MTIKRVKDIDVIALRHVTLSVSSREKTDKNLNSSAYCIVHTRWLCQPTVNVGVSTTFLSKSWDHAT